MRAAASTWWGGVTHERSTDHGHRGRVRHLSARPARRQPDGHLVAGGQRVRRPARAEPRRPGPVGLRGGVAAARRPRLHLLRRRLRPGGRARRRGPRPGERDTDQRRPPLRRPRAPGVQHPRVHQPAGHRALGQGRRTGDGRGVPPGRDHPRHPPHPALQEQHRQQGRLVRVARELPDAPADPVRRHRRPPDAVLRHPADLLRRRPGRHRPGRLRRRLPDLLARRLLRGRGRPGDHPQAADHQHPRRAALRRRQVPPAARHHRRRQPLRDLHLPQGRHHRAGARHDRGEGVHRRARHRRPGRRSSRRSATTRRSST